MTTYVQQNSPAVLMDSTTVLMDDPVIFMEDFISGDVPNGQIDTDTPAGEVD